MFQGTGNSNIETLKDCSEMVISLAIWYSESAVVIKQDRLIRVRSVCKKRGLSISRYGTSNTVNNSYYMTKPKIFQTFTDNLPTIPPKNIFHKIGPKSFSQGFLLIFKFSENCPKTHQELYAK